MTPTRIIYRWWKQLLGPLPPFAAAEAHGREARDTDVLTPMTVEEVADALRSMPPEAKTLLVATEGCDGCLGSVLAVRLVREDGCIPYVLIAREGVSFYPRDGR